MAARPRRACIICSRPFEGSGSRCRAHNRRRGWSRYNPPWIKLYATSRWQEVRSAQLAEFPDCQAPGCSRRASHCDHVLPLAEGGDFFAGPFQSLCERHHKTKTGREGHRGQKRKEPTR